MFQMAFPFFILTTHLKKDGGNWKASVLSPEPVLVNMTSFSENLIIDNSQASIPMTSWSVT